MKKFRVVKRIVSEAVYTVEANSEEEACEMVTEEMIDLDDWDDSYGVDSYVRLVEEIE